MTLTYGGYNIASMASHYDVRIIPRTVSGPNPIDSIAGTHEPDDLAQKFDVTVLCLPILTDAQLNTLMTLARNAIDVPYQQFKYVNGAVNISGEYNISVGQAKPTFDQTGKKCYGGVVLTFTQR